MQHLLRSFDPVRGLVCGSWGEASPDVEKLPAALAHIGAQEARKYMLRRTQCALQQVPVNSEGP